MKPLKLFLLVLLGLFMGIPNLLAQSDETINEAASQNVGTDSVHHAANLWQRKTLTDNYFGLGNSAKEHGVTIKTAMTTFSQGMLKGDGGSSEDHFRSGTKFGATILLNGEKLGLWKGFFAVVRGEYNAGLSVNGYGNTFLPVNAGLRYPGQTGADRSDASWYLIQFLSTQQKVILGKLSMFDLTCFAPIKGGSGLTGFENVSYITSPNGITTPSVLGAFFITETKHYDYTLALYGANNEMNKFGFKQAFEDGVTAYGSFDIPIKIAGLKGKQGVFALWSSKEKYNLSDFLKNINPKTDKSLVGHRYSYGYYFSQDLYESPTDKKYTVGLFGQAVKTDGQSTPTDWGFVVGGGGGTPWRHQDRWGIAYFKYSLLNNLVGIPTSPVTGIPGKLQPYEAGTEIFYDMQLLPWMSVGADYQYISPGASKNGASFLGFRSRIKI